MDILKRGLRVNVLAMIRSAAKSVVSGKRTILGAIGALSLLIVFPAMARSIDSFQYSGRYSNDSPEFSLSRRVFDLKLGEIQTGRNYAWGEKIGWVDFAPKEAGLKIGANILYGWIRADNLGWICLGQGRPADGFQYSNRDGRDFGVNNDGWGNLSGWAWSEAVGWINFDGVRIGRDGTFRGYARSKHIGEVNFGAEEAVKYSVKTDPYPWKEIRGGEGIRAGAGGLPSNEAGLVAGFRRVEFTLPSRPGGPDSILGGEIFLEIFPDGFDYQSGEEKIFFFLPVQSQEARGPPARTEIVFNRFNLLPRGVKASTVLITEPGIYITGFSFLTRTSGNDA